ncbi:SHOCT domain-containing protein [Okibacterium fritillariae]|uniref:Short C-terminal domain-containing protein n=1 Tax=Okibacterium fritillariae TaxID=123320 RepID=A0A1T5KUC4_9MICO|nr:SHOCT domain-containing protein [Okibacterium fritillariae]SKC67253.1 Short C-terminal domain-containing protein [Okibacterium fritillariae]
MPFLRRIGRGGLLQAAARTAVIAGTATAVSGGIRRFQERDRYDEAPEPAPQGGPQGYGQQNYGQPASGTMPTPAQAAEHYPTLPGAADGYDGADGSAGAAGGGPGPVAGPAGGADLMQQLEQLAALHQQGALTAEEFGAAKSKLLGL